MPKLTLILHLLVFLVVLPVYAQSDTSYTLNKQLVDELMLPYKSENHMRQFLAVDEKQSAKYNPLTYVAGGLMYFYQNVISEQISATCNYEISCSEYTKRSIACYGLIKGILVGLHQLSCCTPTISADYCDYQVSPDGKIINHVGD